MKINPDTLEICQHYVEDKEFPISNLLDCVELEDRDFEFAIYMLEKYQKFNELKWWKDRFDDFLSGKKGMRANTFIRNLKPDLSYRKKASTIFKIEEDIERHFNWEKVQKVLGLIQTSIDLRSSKIEFQKSVSFNSLEEFLTDHPTEEED